MQTYRYTYIPIGRHTYGHAYRHTCMHKYIYIYIHITCKRTASQTDMQTQRRDPNFMGTRPGRLVLHAPRLDTSTAAQSPGSCRRGADDQRDERNAERLWQVTSVRLLLWLMCHLLLLLLLVSISLTTPDSGIVPTNTSHPCPSSATVTTATVITTTYNACCDGDYS